MLFKKRKNQIKKRKNILEKKKKKKKKKDFIKEWPSPGVPLLNFGGGPTFNIWGLCWDPTFEL